MSTDLRIAVIADDFTGAMDSGVMFARYGLHTEFHLSQSLSDVEVIVVSSDSREKDEQSAIASIKQTASQFVNRRLFKKIDSTMRGHISAEIDALLQVTGLEKALICPTAVGAGRIVRDGNLFVHGTPLHETAFADDPHYPARTSHLQEILLHPSSMHIDLDSLNNADNTVLDTIQQSNAKLITFDAISHQDLAIIANIAIDKGYLLCGSMGLASAWIDSLLGDDKQDEIVPAIDFNTEKPLLMVTGSRHPMITKQITALIQHIPTPIIEVSEQFQPMIAYDQLISHISHHEVVILQTPYARLDDHAIVSHIYGFIQDFIRKLCNESKFSGLAIIGGETAFHVCQSLGATAIRILGEIESGVPVGRIIGGCATSLPIVTKAGGFGTELTLYHVVDWLRSSH